CSSYTSSPSHHLSSFPTRRSSDLVRIQLVVFALLASIGVVYVGLNYVGIGAVLTHSTYKVSADFPAAGGIYVNADVTYNGVHIRSEEHTSELQSRFDLVCRLLLEK